MIKGNSIERRHTLLRMCVCVRACVYILVGTKYTTRIEISDSLEDICVIPIKKATFIKKTATTKNNPEPKGLVLDLKHRCSNKGPHKDIKTNVCVSRSMRLFVYVCVCVQQR